MVQTYYKLRGWSDDGKPTRELLDRLEIAAESN
jgi:aldehyde:ferredoxin oxidoreductase